MGKKRKSTRSQKGLQVVTLCISTTLVLVLLGFVVFSVLTARNLSAYVKEHLTVTVMLNDDVSVNQAHRLCRDLYHRPYSFEIDYISKEQAKREQTLAMGSDPSEFLGFNPFTATLEVRLKADYVNRDSLKWIVVEMKKHPEVTDVAYQEDLTDKVHHNLQKINLVLLVLAVLLTCVSFSLISSMVKLDVYSRRFLIHTMKLVGASWGFIRRPFMLRALWIGLAASVLADGVLLGGMHTLWQYDPTMQAYVTQENAIITAVAVLACGLLLTLLCTFISVSHFLSMREGELYG